MAVLSFVSASLAVLLLLVATASSAPSRSIRKRSNGGIEESCLRFAKREWKPKVADKFLDAACAVQGSLPHIDPIYRTGKLERREE